MTSWVDPTHDVMSWLFGMMINTLSMILLRKKELRLSANSFSKLFFNPSLEEIFHGQISIGKKSFRKSIRCVSSLAFIKSLIKLKSFGIIIFNLDLHSSQNVVILIKWIPNAGLFFKCVKFPWNIMKYRKCFLYQGFAFFEQQRQSKDLRRMRVPLSLP